jgi:RND family efflux transporter MFP subunit
VRDLTRGERLYADQVISLEQLQDLRTQAALQQAALRSAEFNLDYAVIRAPQDGVVLRKLAEAREQVPAGQTVLILGARDRGYVVRANLADREIVQVQLGDPVTLRLHAFPGTTASGRVTERASAADERTGLFTIEVRFDTEPEGLVSGLVAKLDIRPASALRESLAHVPIAALVEGDHDRAAVFLIDAGHARRRAIRIGFIAQDSVAVAAGLAPGDLVATDGALYLEDGTAVRVMDAADAAARE